MSRNKKGFTLIELLVVIAIIGLLSTLSILTLNSARARARDAKRVSDISQVRTALELYYNDMGTYPTTASGAAGLPISTDNGTYLQAVPTAPTPHDGDCDSTTNLYAYTMQDSGASYTISYCLGGDIGDVDNGVNTATPAGLD